MIRVADEVRDALAGGGAVVALETTLVAHGFPPGEGVEVGLESERQVREAGAVPATVGVLGGEVRVGLTEEELGRFGPFARKVGPRDLAAAAIQSAIGATTVGGTLAAARAAGIRVLATGGIGGVHRGAAEAWDVSADLTELARTPVAVVCAGAKSILDLPRTLEVLETCGVPVVGYGTDDFPAFYLRGSGEPVPARVDTAEGAADLLAAHWALDGAGVVLAQPVAADVALGPGEWERALREAEAAAARAGVRGKDVTPFLLARLAELTGGNEQVPKDIDGISILPTLLSQPGTQKQHDYLYWEFYEQGSRQAVRFGRWKAIREPMLSGQVQLYDLSVDVGEENDLAAAQPEIVKRAVRLMEEAHVPDPKWVPIGQAR